MVHHTPLIATLCAGLVLAFILGWVASRIRLSPLVGYLLAGIIIGPFTPGYVADQELIPQLAELGVILLMFGVGLHFSLDDLLSVKHIAIPGALAQIAAATAMGAVMAWLLGWGWGAGLVFGLALSVASTVVLLRALEERRLVETPRGKIAVGWLIVEDLAMVLALVLLPAFAHGTQQDGGSLPITIAITLGKVAAFVAFMLLVGRRVIPALLERAARSGSKELFTLSVLSIALGVAFGSAMLFGVSFALGAFFAGMVLNESELSHDAARDSLPLRDAFAVLFFVSVGMLFDPSILVREPLQVLATCLIIVAGKSLAAFAIVRLFGHPATVANTIAVSLAQIGEFSFILAAMGLDLQLIEKPAQDLILAGAILSILLNPLLFVLLDRREQKLAVDRPRPMAPLTWHNHMVLIGFGRVGSLIADGLNDSSRNIVVIETQDVPADNARARGIPVIYGNAVAPDLLSAAGIQRAGTLLVASPNVLESARIIKLARKQKPDLYIIARAHSASDEAYLKKRGANETVMGEREIARCMAALAMTSRVPSQAEDLT
ncbi:MULTISPECIES: YbaL family putative K(+) efflux transporter [Hydrocarboniphaga]|uniref:Potassium efflux system protein n=1 Tax=Hydrocarboniphaga effusa AP103 TaxID=1172194 RepID=I8TDD2_9GAMM|nr:MULTISPECIES: YbaL family putative K(+) efflux transporter [Hydrocarboniphaga]EIT71723.1 potassium efflux system protein [Hydrocarboniphaga effusa AP103]MDZ4080347.1 YbaL family putative K(+) efflux transporter [Hydrocarboniphaga sp.]